MSNQDKDIVFNGMLKIWDGEYTKMHNGELPLDGNVTFYDMANNQVRWDSITTTK